MVVFRPQRPALTWSREGPERQKHCNNEGAWRYLLLLEVMSWVKTKTAFLALCSSMKLELSPLGKKLLGGVWPDRYGISKVWEWRKNTVRTRKTWTAPHTTWYRKPSRENLSQRSWRRDRLGPECHQPTLPPMAIPWCLHGLGLYKK